MKKTIIFLNGFAVPVGLSKTKYVWNHSLWKEYNTIYYTSKVPLSDEMVEEELDNLLKLSENFENPIIAGHSLGAWWASNLACLNQFKTSKMVLWTPLGNHMAYPIFNASSRFLPGNKLPSPDNRGDKKVLLCYGSHDLIVPSNKHTPNLIKLFNPLLYKLYGGHLYQVNHQDGLLLMKKWIESV